MEKYLAAKSRGEHRLSVEEKNYGISIRGLACTGGRDPVDLIATAYWAYDATSHEPKWLTHLEKQVTNRNTGSSVGKDQSAF